MVDKVNGRKFCWFVIILLVGIHLNGQSIFSFRGEGESILRGDAYMSSIGYAEIPGTFSSNVCGSIILQDKTGLNVSYSAQRLEMMDNNGKNIMHYYGIPYLKAGVMLPSDLSIGFSLKKKIDFNSNFTGEPDSVNGFEYEETFLKRGQISEGRIELGKRIGNHVGIGFGLNVLFGGSDEVWVSDFSDTLFNDTEDSLNSQYVGYSFSYGISIAIKPLKFSLGYDMPISCERETKSLSYFRKDTVLSKNELQFPSSIVGGCQISALEDLDLFFTLRYEDWSNFTCENKEVEEYSDVLSLSVGLEYVFLKGYKRKGFPLRIGYFTKPWYFEDSYGENIGDVGFTMGTSVPILRESGFLDVSLIMGLRNSKEIEERYYGFKCGFDFFERW
jgi:hypothetical protein